MTAASSLAWTLGVFAGAEWVYRRSGRHPLANPTAWSIVALIGLLKASGTSYETYASGASLIHFLLGPATVALGVALHAQLPRIRTVMVPALVALLAGSVVGILSAVLLARLFGADRVLLATLAPKSVTTPIAMGISQATGGEPSLTAVVVILTGLFGAVAGPPVLDLVRCRNLQARGFAMGLSCHGLGTATAFGENEESGTFAGLAMGLNGLLTALLVPLLLRLLAG